MEILKQKDVLFRFIAWGVLVQSFIGASVVWEGEGVALTCGPKGCRQGVDVYWKKKVDGKSVTIAKRLADGITKIPDGLPWSSKDLSVDQKGALRIASVTYPRDEGNYTCMCESKPQHKQNLKVYQKVKSIRMTGPERPIPEGTEVTLTCRAEGGRPPPTITWDTLGSSTQPEPTVTDFTSQISLIVTKNMNQKSVNCMVTQDGHIKTDRVILDITYKPEVAVKPNQTGYSEGDVVTLRCAVDSNPKADVIWSRDPTTPDGPIRVVGNSANYRIARFDQSHKGNYTCTAVNSEGTGAGWINLTVKDDYINLTGKGHEPPLKMPWILAGSAAAIALLLAGMWICYSYCKPRLVYMGGSQGGRVDPEAPRENTAECATVQQAPQTDTQGISYVMLPSGSSCNILRFCNMDAQRHPRMERPARRLLVNPGHPMGPTPYLARPLGSEMI